MLIAFNNAYSSSLTLSPLSEDFKLKLLNVALLEKKLLLNKVDVGFIFTNYVFQ